MRVHVRFDFSDMVEDVIESFDMVENTIESLDMVQDRNSDSFDMVQDIPGRSRPAELRYVRAR